MQLAGQRMLLSSGGRSLWRIQQASTQGVEALDKSRMQKTELDGECDVIAVNVLTDDRSVVRLGRSTKEDGASLRSRRFRRLFILPETARAGLREVLLSCKRSPRQLQHEADQLTEKIKNRRFPLSADSIRHARQEIRRKYAKKRENNADEVAENIAEEEERRLQKDVRKQLKKSFTWQPLKIESREAAAAYALSRLAAGYAETSRVLEEFAAAPDFHPSSVLDFGSGCGGVFWAVHERFKDSLKEICLVEAMDELSKVAMDLMRVNPSESAEGIAAPSADSSESSRLIHPGVSFRRQLLPSLAQTFDLVISHRSFIEIPNLESRLNMVESLWKRTNRYLVLIESGLEDSFSALMDLRNFLLESGVRIRKDECESLLKVHNRWTDSTSRILHQTGISEYERFQLLSPQMPAGVSLPTELPTASLFAPCPHDMGCPKHAMSLSCNFRVQWDPIRADGKKGTTGTNGQEASSISFIILEKKARPGGEPLGRILEARKLHGHVVCDVCTAFKGIQRISISKRAGDLYKAVRGRNSGEVFPLRMRTQQTQSQYDLLDIVKQND